MKTIGIIGAMEEEVAGIRAKMEIISSKNIVGLDFYVGKLSARNVILVRSGIGKVNAAICTQVLIDLYGADLVINIGVAGAIDKSLDIGDIVISSDVVHHDFDTTAFGDALGIIPRMKQSFFSADENLIKIAKNVGETVLKNRIVLVARIASGDQFISDKDTKERIVNTFNPACVEMEGAAIAQTCYLNKIPFVIIRSMSDKADDSADDTYANFMEAAAQNSSLLIENMITEI